ncbi:hypothetical protein B5M42_009700 [Paenibacillus athensensis]|uniref:Uncharacterized protein n=1 Tax=Paenibacillus athensensis TaxID=1967502 RepID=A0A4Y8Q9N1_9BACL|nr:hypothetical protein [Paenibacillus athensensis]MCD1259111.1 hypothetical protein [Paenibacillus athensensis]
MAAIQLRPDLKTAGGEVCDIMYEGEFAGTLTLVYRESDRLSGSVQLERQSLSASDKERVLVFVKEHVEDLVRAVRAQSCEVFVTYSDYELIIATEHALQTAQGSGLAPRREPVVLHEDEADYEWVQDGTRFDDVDPDGGDEFDMEMVSPSADSAETDYELVIVGEKRNRVEYHVYDDESELIAECALVLYGADVVGEINWRFDPFEEEMNRITELLVADFDETLIDTYVLHMNYNGETIDTIELTHRDLLEEADSSRAPVELEPFNSEDYTVVLARDDGDTLTYEIYQQSYGGLPIGTATVDISERQLTGFIDFREPGNADDRELIAMLLLDELDKEKDYETVNFSMLYRNKLIDEILFESEQVH